ncbi:MAG: ATP-binding protein [Fibrobacter sp.]|nr:ATP-binding protein [Fibrobacter sp.]
MDIIREQYLKKLRKYYDSSLVKVLTGIRRCGKSVLLQQVKEEILREGKTTSDHIIVINFEDLAFAKITNCQKLNAYVLKRITDGDKYYVFLDEIQHVRQFERALASLKAMQNVSLFVTGSNSKLLSGKLASLLVGRCKEFKIMPFSYAEYREYLSINGLTVENPLQNYLRLGGMPQRLDYDSEEDAREYLRSLYDGIVNKDICHAKSKIVKESFDAIARYVITNCAKEFSSTNVAEVYSRENGDPLFRPVVYRYLEKMEQAFLISRAPRYDIASKRNLKTVEKQFAMDNGLILACSTTNQISPSHALENLVYNELKYRGYEVFLGKTYKGEIDFVAMKGGKKCFIQVAYSLADEAVAEREFSAYDSVRDQSPKYVMSLDTFDMSRNGVIHLNIEDWLMGKAELFLS